MNKFRLISNQSLTRTFLSILLLILLTQCTSRYSQKETEQIPSTERVSAKTSSISVSLPQNWRVIDANDSTYIDLWLISSDDNSSLSLIPLNNSETKQTLSEWVNVSKLFNNMQFKKENIEIVDEGTTDIKGIKCTSYYFKVKYYVYRISVFKFNNMFFELTALDKDLNKNSSSQIEYLTKYQTAFISSIK